MRDFREVCGLHEDMDGEIRFLRQKYRYRYQTPDSEGSEGFGHQRRARERIVTFVNVGLGSFAGLGVDVEEGMI